MKKIVVAFFVLLAMSAFVSAGDIIVKDGKLGIGTDPTRALTTSDVIFSSKGLAPASGNLSNVIINDSKIILYDYTGANWAGIGVDNGGMVWLRTGLSSNNFVVIDGAGKVGIGTTAPNAKLTIKATGSSTEDVTRGIDGGDATAWQITHTSSQPTYFMKNNVGIGTSSPATKLHVVGTIRQTNAVNCGLSANANGDIGCSSDENKKNIIGYYEGGIDELMQVKPIKYSFKDEDYVHVGFSAQNVQGILPEGTPTQSDGYLGLDTTAIIALQTRAIQDLKAEVDELRQEIATLKK